MTKSLIVHKVLQGAFCVVAIAAISACSNHPNDYLTQSAVTPSLAVPATHHKDPFANQYPVPSLNAHDSAQPALNPPGLNLAKYKTKKNKK